MVEINKEEIATLQKQIALIREQYNSKPEQFYKERATRNYIINKILKSLGYDVGNPDDVEAEYGAEILEGAGVKDEVDYLIRKENNPIMIIEAKPCENDLSLGKSLLNKTYKQAEAYYNALVKDTNDRSFKKHLSFVVITNGWKWLFYIAINGSLQKNVYFDIDIFNIHNDSNGDKKLSTFLMFGKKYYSYNKIKNFLLSEVMIRDCKKIIQEELANPDKLVEFFKEEYKKADFRKNSMKTSLRIILKLP